MKLRTMLDHIEAGLIRAVIGVMRLLDVRVASDLLAFIVRNLGPLIPVSRVADANLRLAMPELDAAARRRVIREVWDNLGRTVAELPHLATLDESIAGPGWEIVGREVMEELAASPGPAIMVGAHIANWEIGPVAMSRLGLRLGVFYRAATNNIADRIILDLREQACRKKLPGFPKGAAGARQAAMHLARGGHLGLLIDQKLNNGIAVPFFGHMAMTAPAAAALAIRFKAKLVPCRLQRIGRVRYRATVEAPLELPNSGDTEADIAAVTATLNLRLESWIRDTPGQWLWLHRRWPKEATAALPPLG